MCVTINCDPRTSSNYDRFLFLQQVLDNSLLTTLNKFRSQKGYKVIRKNSKLSAFYSNNLDFPGWKRGTLYIQKNPLQVLPNRYGNTDENIKKIKATYGKLFEEFKEVQKEVSESYSKGNIKETKQLWDKEDSIREKITKKCATDAVLEDIYYSSGAGYYYYGDLLSVLSNQIGSWQLRLERGRVSYSQGDKKIIEIIVPESANIARNSDQNDPQRVSDKMIYPYSEVVQKIRKFFGLNPLYSKTKYTD